VIGPEIRAVVLDIDDTLVDTRAAFAVAIQAVLDDAGFARCDAAYGGPAGPPGGCSPRSSRCSTGWTPSACAPAP
jgi:hypothetical protein